MKRRLEGMSTATFIKESLTLAHNDNHRDICVGAISYTQIWLHPSLTQAGLILSTALAILIFV